MKLVKTEKLEGSKYELHVSVEKETYEAALTKAFQKESKKISINGFRKGKAPRSVIERMYGKDVFADTAINDLLPQAYDLAIAESGLEVVAQPDFDAKDVASHAPTFIFTVYVKPEVALSDYLGLSVTRTVEPVTDEEVDREIETVRQRNSRETEVLGRAAEMGDTAVIDYEGFCDGVAFEGGKGEDYALKLGSNTFIPGFEEGVVGKKVDEEFDVNVTFPTEYHSADLAGKAAVFKCKLHSLTRTELPELDDEFAKDVSEFDTLAEYKADLKAKIEKRHNDSADAMVNEKLIETLIEKMVADIPTPMFDAEVENMVREQDMSMRQSGFDLNTYFKFTGMTLEGLREQLRPRAEKQVKARLALDKIVELEKIEATDEEIDAEIQRIADAYNMPFDQVKASIPADSLAADMRAKKAMELVREKAVVTDEAPAAEKKPAKKAPAKKTAAKKADADKAE